MGAGVNCSTLSEKSVGYTILLKLLVDLQNTESYFGRHADKKTKVR